MLAKVIWCYMMFLVTISNGLVLKDTSKFFGPEKTNSEIYEICTSATATNDSTGTFQSPGFPSEYIQHANCYFYINATYGSNIQINVNYLNTFNGTTYGYLQISNSSMSVAKLYGRLGSVDYNYSVGNYAIIHFYLYGNGYYGSFRLTWK
uniref:CUB domain-containing protein n=1 Tax=Panagrolaimus superbus TaxID=310955 RepID=A0A914XVE5_9BILA